MTNISAKNLFQSINILNLRQYMPFIVGHHYLKDSEIQIIKKVLKEETSNRAIVEKYEIEYANMVGDGYCVSYASGRMAFYALLKYLGVKAYDEIILQAANCAVMVNAILRIGAIPVFVDINIENMGMSVQDLKTKLTDRTKVIVAQHSFGIPCEIDTIVTIARQHGAFVLEDCALSTGSSYKNVKVGNWGDAAIFSTDHTKPLNTLVGGLLYTRNQDIYNSLLRSIYNAGELSAVHQKKLYFQLILERKYLNHQKYYYGHLVMKAISTIRQKCGKDGPFLVNDYNKPGDSQRGISYPYPARLPAFLAQLGLFEIKYWAIKSTQRARVLKEYLQIIKNNGMEKIIPRDYLDPNRSIIPLRLLAHYNISEKETLFFNKHFPVRESWFRKPIIASDNLIDMGYKYGNCPIAEFSSKTIINFPSDWNTFINSKISKWLQNIS